MLNFSVQRILNIVSYYKKRPLDDFKSALIGIETLNLIFEIKY